MEFWIDDWTLRPVTPGERPLLAQLLQLYLYDFTEFDHNDVDSAGSFRYHELDRYGTEPGHHALLLRVGGRPAGFVLVDERSPLPGGAGCHYVHEFFIMRAYRRRGIGTAVAHAVFDRFPGRWQIEEIGPNLAAQTFWRRTIAAYTGDRYVEYRQEDGRMPTVIQEFDTRDKVLP